MVRFCTNFQLNWSKFQKPSKIYKKREKKTGINPWVLPVILTPLVPLGALKQWRYKSFKICYEYFATVQWRRLAEIFSLIKMISHVRFISLALKIVILSVAIATKLTISKIYHLIRLRFEQSEHKKSQCDKLNGQIRGYYRKRSYRHALLCLEELVHGGKRLKCSHEAFFHFIFADPVLICWLN